MDPMDRPFVHGEDVEVQGSVQGREEGSAELEGLAAAGSATTRNPCPD